MSEFELTDEVLIKQFQSGDVRAFNKLVIRYKDRLLNFIYGYVNDIDRAEDLVQDTFMKVYIHKDSYQEIAKFSTWMYTIAANLAKTELRKIKRRKTFSISDLSKDDREYEIHSSDKDPSELDSFDNMKIKIQKALVKLPLDFRTIIILRDFQELSYEEISNIVNVPLGTVKSRINRGRLKLQELIK